MQHPVMIIAGAEKAGTTSLFAYLAAHPQVCASNKKETDHFRSADASLESYLAYFDGWQDGQHLTCVEASPGYMAESDTVAARLAGLVPEARLVFLLRDPIDRLRSSFRFYKSRLHVPEAMSFEQFANVCLAHELGQPSPAAAGIKAWHLRALARGRYDLQLPHFQRCFPASQLLPIHYDDLRDDVRATVMQAARLAGIDPAFYEGFQFGRENVSFLAKRSGLQRVAIFVNDRFEGVWRSHPQLKRKLMGLYKRVNERELEPDPLSPATESRLRDWYGATYALLSGLPRLAAPRGAVSGAAAPR